MVVLYQTLKRQLTDFYEMVDEFRNNNNKRPAYLDYNKIKMRGIDDLKKWSDETQDYVIDEKQPARAAPVQPVQPDKADNRADEMDLLGLDLLAAAPQKQAAPPKQDLLEIDLLGNDYPQAPRPAPAAPNNFDLFDLNLNVYAAVTQRHQERRHSPRRRLLRADRE